MITVDFTGTPLSGDEPLTVAFTSSVVITDDFKTGGKGDNPSIYKPTGLLGPKKKKVEKRVEQRVEDSKEIEAEVVAQLAKEFRNEAPEIPVQQMSPADISAEISARLHKQMQDEEDDDKEFIRWMLRQ